MHSRKTVYGPKSAGAIKLLSADGSTFLKDKDPILESWEEHVNSVFNRQTSIHANVINILPQVDCNVLNDEFPTVIETRKTIVHRSSWKVPGTDEILA